jgi:hypothetical protein
MRREVDIMSDILTAYKVQAMHVTNFSEVEVDKMTDSIMDAIQGTSMTFNYAIKYCVSYMICFEPDNTQVVVDNLRGVIKYMEMEGFNNE